jgi:hypothetical protein
VLADDRVGAIPITDARDRVVGIVSYLDLLGWLSTRAERPPPGGPPARGRRTRVAASPRAVKRAPAKNRKRRAGGKKRKPSA